MGARSTSGVVLTVGISVTGVLGGGVLETTLQGAAVGIGIPLTGVVLTTGSLVGIDGTVSLTLLGGGVPVTATGGHANGLVGQLGAGCDTCAEDVVVVAATVGFAECGATVVELNITAGDTFGELGTPFTGIAEGLAFNLGGHEFTHLGAVVVCGVPYAFLICITGKHSSMLDRAGSSADPLGSIPQAHACHLTGSLREVVAGRTALIKYGIPLTNTGAVIGVGAGVLTSVDAAIAVHHAHDCSYTTVGVEGRALRGTLARVGVPLAISISSAGGAGEGSGVASLLTQV